MFRKILLCLVCGLVVVACQKDKPQASANRLLLGENAKIAAPHRVDFASPLPLTGMSQDELLGRRSGVMNSSAALLQDRYVPWRLLFNSVDFARPWRSVRGVVAGNSSERCGEGVSVEALPILNPLMLAFPHFGGFSPFNQNFEWDENKSTYDERIQSGFPLVPKPQSLTYYPSEKRAVLSYNLSLYLQQVVPLLKRPLTTEDYFMALGTYNARDFGYSWSFVPSEKLENVKLVALSKEPWAVDDYPMLRRFSEKEPSCNSASLETPPLRDVALTGLPAKVSLMFWINRPAAATDPADLEYLIEFN